MIVVDASIVGPMALLDEPPLPPEIVAALTTGPLIAPAHWPFESTNMLLVAYRRERLDDRAWQTAFNAIDALGVDVVAPTGLSDLLSMARLAQDHRLTLYDSAYLHLAMTRAAMLATLDGDLIDAARTCSVPVLTYA